MGLEKGNKMMASMPPEFTNAVITMQNKLQQHANKMMASVPPQAVEQLQTGLQQGLQQQLPQFAAPAPMQQQPQQAFAMPQQQAFAMPQQQQPNINFFAFPQQPAAAVAPQMPAQPMMMAPAGCPAAPQWMY